MNSSSPTSIEQYQHCQWLPWLQPKEKVGVFFLYTHQTENVCADPPSKPACQDMFACLTPGEMDREVAAWGLVPVMEATGEELVDVGQHFN